MKKPHYLLFGTFLMICSQQLSMAQTQKGSDIYGKSAGYQLGYSISMPDANTLAAGAKYYNENVDTVGYVQVFQWDGSSWIQKGKDIQASSVEDKTGASVYMPDPNTLAIGSNKHYKIRTYPGLVRIFKWNGSKWIQKGKDFDSVGVTVSMPDSNTLAIGAHWSAGSGTLSYPGHVRIYDWTGKSWQQRGYDIFGEAGNDMSGVEISMPDDVTIAIGARANDDNGRWAGHVRVHQWNGASWIQKGQDIDGEVKFSYAGESVSMPDANTVAIGSHDDYGSSGHVRIFTWDGTLWAQKGPSIDGKSDDGCAGLSLSMPNPNMVAVAANCNEGGFEITSHARIYAWNGQKWAQIGRDLDGDAVEDRSGYRVCMPDANTVALGVSENDKNGPKSGQVRVFDLSAVSIKEGGLSLGVELYPNPTNNLVHLQLQKNPGLLKMTINSPQGQVLREEYINNPAHTTFDLPQASGMYFITIQPLEGLPAHFNVLKL